MSRISRKIVALKQRATVHSGGGTVSPSWRPRLSDR
jgi:hypothetical protein